jgi:hypothetical protein
MTEPHLLMPTVTLRLRPSVRQYNSVPGPLRSVLRVDHGRIDHARQTAAARNRADAVIGLSALETVNLQAFSVLGVRRRVRRYA